MVFGEVETRELGPKLPKLSIYRILYSPNISPPVSLYMSSTYILDIILTNSRVQNVSPDVEDVEASEHVEPRGHPKLESKMLASVMMKMDFEQFLLGVSLTFS